MHISITIGSQCAWLVQVLWALRLSCPAMPMAMGQVDILSCPAAVSRLEILRLRWLAAVSRLDILSCPAAVSQLDILSWLPVSQLDILSCPAAVSRLDILSLLPESQLDILSWPAAVSRLDILRRPAVRCLKIPIHGQQWRRAKRAGSEGPQLNCRTNNWCYSYAAQSQ